MKLKPKLLTLTIILALVVMSVVSCHNNDEKHHELLLSQSWKMQSSAKIDLSGRELSQKGVDIGTWYDAEVPSTVMGTLTRNGLYPNILEGENYKKIDKSLFDCSWWYRTEFAIDKLQPNEHLFLEMDGISYRANVWFNGEQIASKDVVFGPYRRFKFDITKYAKRKNVLAVELFRAKAGEPNIGFVDWNPRPADESMGIFREVHIKRCREVEMTCSVVKSKVNVETLKEAWLTIETCLKNISNKTVKGELVGSLEGKIFHKPIELTAGETCTINLTSDDVKFFHMKNPRLWWCHNMGTPEMYRMNLKFEIDGHMSDSETVDFGIREIKDYFTKEGYRGFLLNGKRVLIRSAGWSDDIFLRNIPKTNEMQVQYVCDMNLNSIRFENIWGTSQNIYDLCDRYGLLALVGWSCQWEWEEYIGSDCDFYGGIKSQEQIDLIARSFRDQVLWLRNHPSIIAWFVGSDRMPRPELEKHYRNILAKLDNRPYITAAKEMKSEISGPSGTKMEGPYEYVAPNYWYKKEAPGGAFGFNTETGIGAQLPVIESIVKMIPPEQLWPMGEAWNFHCTTSTTAMNTMQELEKNMTMRYGAPKDLNDFLRKADLMNYESTRAMFEAFRVNIPHTTGIVQWMLNSAWPSLYWQLYDYYGIPTAAYYSVKKANRIEQLIYDYEADCVVAVNEGRSIRSLKGRIMSIDLKGKILEDKIYDFDIEPYHVRKISNVRRPYGNAFLVLQLMDGEGKRLDDNIYSLSHDEDVYDWKHSNWYQSPIVQFADFTPLARMEQATCEVEIKNEVKNDGIHLSVNLKNRAPQVAFFIRLSLLDAHGELFSPIFWEDNYLSLLPSELRTVECFIPRTITAEGELTLHVSGWNLSEIEKKFVLNKEK